VEPEGNKMVSKALTGLAPKKATEQGWVAKNEEE
jgi:hypothetical protein